jgi:hypothetical protein
MNKTVPPFRHYYRHVLTDRDNSKTHCFTFRGAENMLICKIFCSSFSKSQYFPILHMDEGKKNASDHAAKA